MTRIVAQFDPSTTPAGDHFPTMINTQPFGLVVTNDSPYGLILDFGNALTRVAPPYTERPFKVCVHCETVTWTIGYTVPIPASVTITSFVVVEMYQQSELGDLPKESTGLGRLTGVNNNMPIQVAVNADQITAGTFVAGVLLPAGQVSAGTFPAGVLLPATQLSAGAMGTGITLPAGQVSAGNLPSGVRQYNGSTIMGFASAGGGAAGMRIWVGTTNPSASMAEGDIWWPV